jgi:hypothetical protein
MDDGEEVRQFAAYLRNLKSRSNRSYEALARRSGISGSSLHRYCAGTKVPGDFRAVLAFARVCGASPAEVRELQRLWALADAARDTPRPSDRPGDRPGSVPAPPPAGAGPGVGVPRRPSRALLLACGAGLALVLLLGAALTNSAGGAPGSSDRGLLFSPACREVVSMGQHDACVREVQSLLVAVGGRLAVDGDFGPETLRRVTAFQVLAGLPPRGVVDEETKRALYARRADLRTWPPDRVEHRIRQVFPEEPDRAVAIARCQSFLDPLHVLPNTNGTRNWGVFQLADVRLRELGGTPRQAYDPEWNIQAARRLWERDRDFTNWPHCDQAFRAPAGGRSTSTPGGR